MTWLSLAALSEDPDSVPSTYVVAHTSQSSSRGLDSFDLPKHCTHVIYKLNVQENIPRHKIKQLNLGAGNL